MFLRGSFWEGLFEAWENVDEDIIEDKIVEVSHDEKAEDDSDNAGELGFVVILDAVEEVVGDLAVKNDQTGANASNKKAEEQRREAKFPLHNGYSLA